MNRIQLIFNEKWAMAREDYYNLVSLILPSIHSGNFKEVEAFFEKDTVTAYASDLNFVGRWNLEDSGLPSDSVAVDVYKRQEGKQGCQRAGYGFLLRPNAGRLGTDFRGCDRQCVQDR